jgi:hypothetical protein
MTRMLAADAKAATDRSTMAIVGAEPEADRGGAAGEGIGWGLTGSALQKKGLLAGRSNDLC